MNVQIQCYCEVPGCARNYFSHPTMIYYVTAQATISLLGQSTENYSYIRDYIGELLLYMVYNCGTSYILPMGVTMGVSYGHIRQRMPAQDHPVLPNLVLINFYMTMRTILQRTQYKLCQPSTIFFMTTTKSFFILDSRIS